MTKESNILNLSFDHYNVMPSKDDVKQIYIDTSLLHEWIARLMRGEKGEDTEIIKFLRDHEEITRFISIFTIAELVESLLFHEKRIRDYMKKRETVESLAQILMETTGIRIVEYEKRDEHVGIFISPKIVDYVAKCGSIKDAVHVCIAEHEDLWLVTHDKKFGKLKPLYNILFF